MFKYQNMLAEILATGTQQTNRTGIDAISIPGYMLKFDLRDGFPLLTTKKMAFGAIKGELIGFLRGYTSAAQFRELGCNIWNQNANEDGVDPVGNVVPNAWLKNPNRKGTDDLGRIYGAQWRDWKTYPVTRFIQTEGGHAFGYEVRNGFVTCNSIDQVQKAIDTLKNDPTNRRIIINAWRPDEFDQMALPPCHVLYQFIADTSNNLLHLCMYQRSCDSFLGVPFNIASSALFLTIMARLTGFEAGTFTHFLADTHIYVDHRAQVEEQLSRLARELPRIVLNSTITKDSKIEDIQPSDIWIEEGTYDPHPAIAARMAV